MNKIIIIGYSGSGKSTFAKFLGELYTIEPTYLDAIHFKENWQVVSKDEFEAKVNEVLIQKKWIIDGNYTLVCPQRFEECDKIFFFNFNRIVCLKNALKRFFKYKNQTRFSAALGCKEKMDWEFFSWLLYNGRTKKRKNKFEKLKLDYQEKVIEFKNRKIQNKYKDKLLEEFMK